MLTGIFYASQKTDCVVFHAYIHTWPLAEMPSALRAALSSTFCLQKSQIMTATVLTTTFLHVKLK